ncbi:MAG: HD domain-containing protein [Firmicutes bacterium]|nr:HD domain-containing protein [Bacillota bacterium]
MSKQFYISDLETGSSITEFFMVKALGLKTGANSKQYLDVTLGDSSGEINGKKWDVGDDESVTLSALSEGDMVKVRGQVIEWNGIKQLRIGKIRKYDPETDQLDMNDYVKAAPEDPEAMYQYILAKAISIGDEELKSMAVKFLRDNKKRLLYYPAAMRNHHAELGGLLYHIKRMLMMGEKACDVYTFLKKDWVVCGVILHDMEKLNELQSNELGVSPGYSFEGKMLGHIAQGVKAVEKMAEELGISEEKKIMLEHMILSHHYEPEFGSPVKPLFAEAELLHYLDMTDAKLFDFEEALVPVKPGEFSERVRTLDGRTLYKPSFSGSKK